MKSVNYISESIPTQFVESAGIQFAYRIIGNASAMPLVCLQHFTGTMDDWDPIILEGLAKRRRVIIFNNTGVASTSGETPDDINTMAEDAVAFIRALGLAKVDLLAYSIGGFIGQVISAEHPELVRKLILAGTGPRGGTAIAGFSEYLLDARKREGVERYLFMFYEKSAYSRNLGLTVFRRLHLRSVNRDPASSAQTSEAQTKAIVKWGETEDENYALLKAINQPVMVVNGSNDGMFPTINSYQLFEHLPHAVLSLYPDSAHGGIFQYPYLFVEQATYFLDKDIR